MIVTCAICGYEAVVKDFWTHTVRTKRRSTTWIHVAGRAPEVWICDEHRDEFHGRGSKADV